ncbi:hypothetical protein LNK20_21195, partial [Bacillus safensis]|nr:hypothetical protein [Bacillus safensis]
MLRTATLRRATALRTTGLTRTLALRRRAHVIATLGAGFGLRHTLGGFFLGLAAGISLGLETSFLFRLA